MKDISIELEEIEAAQTEIINIIKKGV